MTNLPRIVQEALPSGWATVVAGEQLGAFVHWGKRTFGPPGAGGLLRLAETRRRRAAGLHRLSTAPGARPAARGRAQRRRRRHTRPPLSAGRPRRAGAPRLH